jgi:hypothetical protein
MATAVGVMLGKEAREVEEERCGTRVMVAVKAVLGAGSIDGERDEGAELEVCAKPCVKPCRSMDRDFGLTRCKFLGGWCLRMCAGLKLLLYGL